MKKDFSKIYLIIIPVIFGVACFLFFKSGDYVILNKFFKIMLGTWWIIFPIPMWFIFKMTWDEYTELGWAIKQTPVYLEIKVPADVEKSPKTMEQVFAGLHSWSTPNKFETYCGWRPLQDKYIFELISLGGEIHFTARCSKAARDNIESQIYAQYPDAEIFEIEDYTKKFPKNLPNKEYDVWGTSLALQEKDALPIKTYKYFKEDVTGKMIDPLASMTEVMSKLSVDQNICLQIIFTPQREDLWHPAAEKVRDEIIGRNVNKKEGYIDNLLTGLGQVFQNVFRVLLGGETEFGTEIKDEREFNVNQLTPGKQDQIRAIEENISKPGFLTAIRFIYFGKKENFNKALGVAGVMGSFKQFADVNLNSFRPDSRTKTFANYFMHKSRLAYRQRKIVQNFKDRDIAGCDFIFNTEELASIYHFPDMSVKTPAIQKIDAKKGDAPTNLPISDEATFE